MFTLMISLFNATLEKISTVLVSSVYFEMLNIHFLRARGSDGFKRTWHQANLLLNAFLIQLNFSNTVQVAVLNGM